MKEYHLRRSEKSIKDEKIITKILNENPYLTIALCNDNKPYLVTLNYVYDQKNESFYIHCANSGKKNEYITNNSHVWGQIMEDGGYLKGECDYKYRTLHFKGNFQFIEDLKEKQRALELMIEKFEEEPEPVRVKFINEKALKNVNIGKIHIDNITGKQGGIKN
ncbi:pyridoxamine 5'-phosphate oxidase family protein [Promethearchaeum syntrophicum]|uniref:Pyridoxamine 5'-phosphate oxidase family protein n=1 Tax=Promethearchaeum syntrophicum TaxID=2594042 RepID=A0A5B9D9P9_9ARCH|nr:pyridoxamine 5'-phosphate oxidase family protein [Candidatus Prometheoarchaeum syntrophicum]QEE15557.1 Pyridoxamine 5'-phosphate oxidase [Candidatus Prometheoarchaeum syntrophicum]